MSNDDIKWFTIVSCRHNIMHVLLNDTTTLLRHVDVRKMRKNNC